MAHREDIGAKDETPEMEARAHSAKFLNKAARLKSKKKGHRGKKSKKMHRED